MTGNHWHERLDALRAKPEATRRRIAFWSSALLTLLIGVVWFSSVKLALAPSLASDGVASKAPKAAEQTAAVRSVGERIKNGWHLLTNN